MAGKEIEGDKIGQWIRPVSARPHEEISEEERRYEDGHTASLLDIVLIPMLEPRPGTFQSENHVIADGYYWEKKASAGWAQVVEAIDNVKGSLWVNGSSTYNGQNDQVPELEAVKLRGSLLLVKPSNLTILVAPEGGVYAPAKRRVRAEFSLNGLHYNFVLTDAAMERKFLRGANGSFPVNDALLCISLGEVFQGHAYKLAAALITPDRVGQNDD